VPRWFEDRTASYPKWHIPVRGSVTYFAVHWETHGMSPPVQVFGRRQRRSNHALRRPASEKRQGTKSRRRVVLRSGRGRYGDLATGRDLQARRLATAIRLELEHNLNVTARMLLDGDFTFCPICNFNELSVAKRAHSTTSA
jgi:hypothetical protein